MSGSLCVKCNMFPGLSLFCFSLLLHAGRGSKDAVLTDTAVDLCSCQKSCVKKFDLTQDHLVSNPSSSASSSISSSSSPSFYFDVALGSCIQLPQLCKTNSKCTFARKTLCEDRCVSGAKLGGDRNHVDKASIPFSPNRLPSSSSRGGIGSDGVRWDLVVSGVCVMVLLVAVLTVTGLFTYNYRQKKRERVRSRYIHNVMEMFDSDSDSSCSDGERTRPHGTKFTKQHRLEL